MVPPAALAAAPTPPLTWTFPVGRRRSYSNLDEIRERINHVAAVLRWSSRPGVQPSTDVTESSRIEELKGGQHGMNSLEVGVASPQAG